MVVPKFRAWLKAEKQMIDVEFLDLSHKVLIGKHWEFGMTEAIKFDDVILMQSTGLAGTYTQDELFEDDVIFWTYFDEFEDTGNARIVYRDGCWKLLDIKTGKEAWDSLFDCLENCTVFLSGNIYENPELVEG